MTCGPKDQGLVGGDIADGEKRVYEVFGMDCPGCHGGLEKLVRQIPGVMQASGNWEKQQLMIIVQDNAQVSDEDIYDAIVRANFTPGKRLH